MRIGIDMGGTKTEVVAIDSRQGELLRRRVPTLRDDYRQTIGALAELARGVETELGRRGTVGVAIPGTLSPLNGLVKNANTDWLNGEPLGKDLSEALQREVRVDNDGNCLALSEATDGAAAGEAVVFAAVLGTGCGGGLVIDGRVVVGRNGLTGEWGHTPLP